MTVINKTAYEKIKRMLNDTYLDMDKVAQGWTDPNTQKHWVYTVDGEYLEESQADFEKIIRDDNDYINLSDSREGVIVCGGNGNDTIYGSKTGPNFLYGDGKWTFFEPSDNAPNYNSLVGSDEIHGGNILNLFHGGLGNDKLYGGSGINVYSFKLGDSNYDSQTGDIIGDVIYPSSGSDYLYFTDVDYKDLYFFKRGDNLVIQANNFEKSVSVTVNNFFKQNTIKGIFDKNADLTRIQEILNSEYASINLAVNDIKNALNDMAAALPPLMTTIQPVTGQNVINIPIGDDTPFKIYTINNVSSSHQLQIGEETDIEAMRFTKSGNDLYIEHQSNGIIILKNYFTKSEKNALHIINGVSLKEYTSANINEWGCVDGGNKIRITQRDNKVTNLTGSFLGDDISIRMDAATVINAANGNDVISIANTSNNTITGGAGENVIYTWCGGSTYYAEENHNTSIVNTINLTKGEKLTIMSYVYKLEDAENVSDVVDIQIVGNDGVITIKGRSLTNPSQITPESEFFDATEKIIIKNLTNNNLAESVNFQLEVKDSEYNTVMEQSYDLLNMYWEKEGTVVNGRGATLNGTVLNDKFTGTEKDDRINAGAGNDLIIGTKGKDLITGGLGNNIIKYESEFDTDTVTLTRNEHLTIDLTEFNLTRDTLKNNISANRGNLEITVPNKGKIILANFVNSNPVGDNGSVKVKLNNTTIFDLNNDALKEISASDYTNKNDRANTATYNGTRFSETVNLSGTTTNNTINGNAGNDVIVSGSGDDKILGGDGDDTITGGTGNDTLTGGKGADTFIFSKGDGVDTITDAVKGDVIQINAKQSELRFMKAGNNLAIGYVGNMEDKITINNYFSNRNKVEDICLLNEAGTEFVSKKIESILPETFDITGKGGINGTNNNETIYGSEANDSINGQGGDDIIYAGEGNDTINGGAGDDVIYGQKGNDTITGGLGSNTVIYKKGDGNDIINLTRGENFTLDLQGISANELTYDFAGGALLISYDNAGTTETIKINNFGNNDVTNNSTRTTEDTSSVMLTFDGANAVDLREKVYNLVKETNYTGNWHKENIDASSYQLYSDRNKTIENNDVKQRGLTINAMGGDDTIIGSKYSDPLQGGDGDDTITGGTGNDTLTGGKGADTFIFSKGDGNDIITDAEASDKIKLLDVRESEIHFMKAGNNLALRYDNCSDILTINNYFSSKTPIESLYALNGNDELTEYSISNLLTQRGYDLTGRGSINGTKEADVIYGSEIKDNINAQGGNDTIYAGEGDDTINGGDGDDTIYGQGGNDTITGGKGTNTLKFSGSFGVDTVNLTRDEHCILDLTAFNLTENSLKSMIKANGATLEIRVTDNDIIKLNNFVNSNPVGDNGSVKVKLGDSVYLDLNNDALKEISASDYTNKNDRANTATYNGTRFSETVNLSGTTTNNTINGNAGNDVIVSGSGDDKILGGDGDDTITGGTGNDTLTGGKGADTFIFSKGDGVDTITDAELGDKIRITDVNSADLRYVKNGNNLEIYYDDTFDTENRIVVTGYFTKKPDQKHIKLFAMDSTEANYVDLAEQTYIFGGSGNIIGTSGNDNIIGSDGADTIKGGNGDDIINPKKGADKIYGEAGNNTIVFNAGDGDDIVYKGNGSDTLKFNNYNDADELKEHLMLISDGVNLKLKYSDNGTVILDNYFKNGTSVVNLRGANGPAITFEEFLTTYPRAIGITGSGTILGTDGNDAITGSAGRDTIRAKGGDDIVYGKGGDDIIHAESGRNVVHGGSGNDTIYGGDGFKLIDGGFVGNELFGDEGNDTIYTSENGKNDQVDGGPGNDTIHLGNTATVVLRSDCGNDTIYCSTLTTVHFADISNNDELENSISIVKNAGGDYQINYGNNVITLKDVNQYGLSLKTAQGEGIKLNNWIADHPLPIMGTDASETLSGDAKDNTIYGLGGNDTIYGQKGNDTIYGGNGDDYIQGGQGNDTINGGAGFNTITFGTGDGEDIVKNGGGTDELYFSSTSGTMSLRRSGDNLIIRYGNDDSVTVEDYYSTSNHSVKYINVNNQRYTVAQAWANWGKDAGEIHSYGKHTSNHMNTEQTVILAPDGGQTITASSQSNQIFGGNGNDRITGGTGRDDIYGGDGNDYIRGGAGEDHLWGGSGANTFEFRSGDGADIIYEFGADNTLYFPDVTSFSQLDLQTSAGSLLSGWHGRNWTQQIMTITGYGDTYDSVKMYNSGYENYKIKIKDGTTISLNQFIKDYHPEVASFITENLGANEGSSFGGTQYVPTNMVPELKPAGYVVQGNADTTVYSGGSITGFGSPSITGGAGNDTIFAGINENGEKIFYFKQNPYADPVQLEGYNDWGYARLCYRVERDAQGNPVLDGTTNADGSQNVKVTQEVKVGGYFYAYTASMEYNDVEHNPDSDDWWDDITLTRDELRTYYNQYLAQKANGTTTAAYEETIAWNEAIDGANHYYDSFTQYKSFSGPGTYEVKVNYYKPNNVDEEFSTGLLTEKFTTTYNGREVTMVISKQQVGANHYGQFYEAYGYGLSADNISVSGGDGNDTIYTSADASGGEGDDTIYTQGNANGDKGNDKLIAFHDRADDYFSQNFDGGAGYDMIDLSRTNMDTKLNEYRYIGVSMSEGVDTVFFNNNNPNARYSINSNWYRPDPDARFIETRYAGYDNYQAGYLRMGDDFVFMNHNQYGGSAIILKDYYQETLDSIRKDIAVSVPAMFAVARYPEYPEFLERYGMLGLQPDNNNLPYMDQWLGVSAIDGDKLYLNAVDYFDNNGQQHAGSFTIFTKNGQKYTTHTAAFDAEQNEKAVNFLSNGNVLYKDLVKYNYNEQKDEYTPEYVTKTILNKTAEGTTDYYVEDWTMNYTLPYFDENVSVAMDVQYGTDRDETRAAQSNGYYNNKGVVYSFDGIDVRQYDVGGQTNKYINQNYGRVVVYEEADGRKYTVSYVDGYYQTDEQGNYVKDEQGNNIRVDGYYQKDYLETNNNGDFVLNVKVGEYYHRGEHGENLYDDITATITIHRNVLEKDGEGNLKFTAHTGNEETHVVNPEAVTYTIKKDAELALRKDGDGYVWYKKIIGQKADGNNETVEVKIGKVNSQGVFTELYGDTDLFNQKTFYEREDVKTTLRTRYLTWEYQQNDFLIGGAGSQIIKAGDGDDTIYGANLPVYKYNEWLENDSATHKVYVQDNPNGTRIEYIYARGDVLQNCGNDLIYGATSKDTLYINIGSPEMTTEFRRYGDNLSIVFFDGLVNTDGLKVTKSVTLKDYFAQSEENRLDNFIVHSDAENNGEFLQGDNNLSLKDKMAAYGIITDTNSMALSIDDAGDTIYGEKGADYIVGGAGNDYIDGGEGADYILAGDGDDTIIGGRGIEYTRPEGASDNVTLTGDIIYGEGGNDTIYSVGKYDNEGNFDAEGSREYLGKYAHDLEGSDHVYQKNTIYGGDGNDTIVVNGWSDTVDAGAGNDTIDLYAKYDPMYSKEGDPLYANKNEYTIDGGDGNDTINLHGEMFAGTVSGGGGDDVIDARELVKSELPDIRWNSTPDGVTINGGAGNDTIHGTIGNDKLSGGDGDDTVYGYDGNDSINVGQELYYRGTSYAYGGDGDDVIYGGGASKLYGEDGNDTIHFATGQTGKVIVPTTLTIDGGSGDDTYIEGDEYGTPGYGYDTIIASSGNDKIIFNNVESESLNMYRNGDDLCFKHATKYAVVGSGVPYENILILKDYYNTSNKIYGDNHNQSAKELFDNYTIVLQNGNVTRGTYTLEKFIGYTTGEIDVITNGIGTPNDDIIEAASSVTNIDAYAGDDNIITGAKTQTVSGGAGNDTVLGTERKDVQFITGDNGKVTNTSTEYQTWNSETGQFDYTNYKKTDNSYETGFYNYTYTPGDSSKDGDDNIMLYADKNYVWGEGGDDTINIVGDSSYNFIWGGDGNDTIHNLPTYYSQGSSALYDGGAGNDTIIGNAEWIDGGSGDDVLKVKNHTGMNYENRQRLLVDLYSKKGVNTEEALEIRQAIMEAGAAIRTAIQNKNDAQNSLTSSYTGYPRLAELQRSKDYYAGQVAQYQQKVDQLDPDYVYSATDYSRNNLAEAKSSLAQYEASIATRQAYIDEQEAVITAADNTIAEKKAFIAEKIAELKVKGYEEFINSYSVGSGVSLVFGGEGNDEITLGFDEDYINAANEIDEPAYQGTISGNYYVRGGAGDDTYIIPDYYNENEKTGEVTHDFKLTAKIEDTQGNNRLILQSQDLDSAGVGVIMNVELDKDANGDYITDEHGNYSYHFKNFQTRVSDSDRAPLGGGDMEYCIVITDSKTYAEGHSDYYGGLYKSGLRFSYETLQTFDRIQASDGKYINIAQINKAAQNVANWLGEHDYPDYQYAVGLEDYVEWSQSNINKAELLGHKGFGSLEWLDDSNSVTSGVTEGTEGTYLSDKLTSTEENEIFNLGTGNDIVTFTGVFGNDVIKSETLTDVDGNAVQSDTLNFREYSIKNGTLRVEVDPDDANSIKFTAYGQDGSVKGTVIYQDAINNDYSSRKIYINDADGENQLIIEDSYKAAKAQDSSNKQLSVYNDEIDASPIYIANSSGEIKLYIRGNMNYNYTQADENTTLAYVGDYNSYKEDNKNYYTSASADIVTSLGETDDQYTIRFTDNTNAIITDMGGNDTLYLYYTSNSDSWNQSQEIRLFFDVDYKGNVSDSLNIVHADKLLTEDAQNVANLLRGEHSMTGVITVNGEIETIETRDKTSRWLCSENNINVTKWKEKITENIKNWLVMNDYKDVGSVLATGDKAVINTVLNFYNLTYAEATGKGNTTVSSLSDKASMDAALMSGTQGADVVNIPNNQNKNVYVNTFDGSDYVEGTVDGAVINTGMGNDAVNITGKNNHITTGAGNDSIKVTAGDNDTNYFYFTTGDGKDTISGTGKKVLVFKNTAIEREENNGLFLNNDPDKYFTLEKRDNDLTIKYSSTSDKDSVTIENYYNNRNNYTMIDKYGVEMKVLDFINSYLADGYEIIEQNNTAFNYTDDTDRVIIPTGTNGYTYNLKGGNDTITGENITGVTINGGSGADVIDISGTGNTINPGVGNDRITITGVGENATNTVVYSQSNNINLLSASNSEIKIKLDFAIGNLSLRRSGDHLIIKHSAAQNGFVITDYFNDEVQNADYKIVDSSNTETVLTTFVDEYGNINELNDFIPEFSNNVINEAQNYDVVGTDGSENILVTKKNTKIDLAGGNDTVNIANSAGGNIITIPYGDYKYNTSWDSGSLADNTATLNFNDTNVNFSVSGNDLIISSEDLSAPVTIKDFVVPTNEKQPVLIVKDKDKTYQVNAGHGIAANGWSNNKTLDWQNDTYNHIAIYDGTNDGNDLTVYANAQENTVYVSGGMQSDVQYRNADGLLTVTNASSDASTGPYMDDTYSIRDFSPNSGILINDAGGRDDLSFDDTRYRENVVRIFFDVKKVNDNYVADMKEQGNGAYNLILVHKDAFDADNLLAALDDNWTTQHTGIIKYNGFGDNTYTNNNQEIPNDEITMYQTYKKGDVDSWVSAITDKVSAWLSDSNHQYNSVSDALQNATEAQKAELLALYDYRIDNHYYELKEGLDTTFDVAANDDTISMQVGVNHLTFGRNFGNDKAAFSSDVYSMARIDDLNFTDFSLTDGTLNVGWGKENDSLNKSVIFTAQDGSSLTYNSTNFYEISDSAQISVTDKDGVYNTTVASSGYYNNTLDWTTDEEKDNNHLAILKGQHSDSNNYFYDINANDEHSVTVTDGGSRLVYRYNSGNDIVNSNSENANDLYRVNSFTKDSSLIINDAGGNDSLIFNDINFDDFRLYFDITKSGNEYVEDESSLTFMHKDVASSLNQNWDNVNKGVIRVNGFNRADEIDTTSDNMKLDEWVDSIKESVSGWLSDNGYTSTTDVFNNPKNEGDIAALIAEYDKTYSVVTGA